MKKYRLLYLAILICLSACTAAKYGATQHLSFNFYNLVTNNEEEIGNRRIRYNMGYHKNSYLDYWLKQNGYPDFIYEYELENKCDGIHLYHLKRDSVFIFEELKSRNPYSSVLKRGRNINEQEKGVYKKLISKN